MKLSPHTALAGAYLAFFLPAGVLLSQLPAYLQDLHDKGLSADQVSWVFAAVFGVKLFTGPLFAWWADRVQRQGRALALAAWVVMAAACLLDVATQFALVLASVMAFAVGRNYAQCLLEALAARHRPPRRPGQPGRSHAGYGSMRAFGSVAVCAGVLLHGAAGWLGSGWQHAALPLMLLLSGLGLRACMPWLSAPLVCRPQVCKPQVYKPQVYKPTTQAMHEPPEGPDRRPLHPDGLLLLAGAAMLIGANGVFYGSGTLLLQQRGVGAASIALLWCAAFGIEALGVAAFDRLVERHGSGRLFAAAVLLSLLRWLLLAMDSSPSLLLLGFGLHMASLSWMHALCVLWMRALWPAHYAVTGQAVYLACAHGIGLAAASWIALRALPAWGAGVYGIAAAMTATGALLIGVRALRQQRSPPGRRPSPAWEPGT